MAATICGRGLLHIRPLHAQTGLPRLLSPSLTEEKLQAHDLRDNGHVHFVPHSRVAAGILAGSATGSHVPSAVLSECQTP